MLTFDQHLKVIGLVEVCDAHTGEILVDTHNAIHPENMSVAIATAMGNKAGGSVYQMVFGNGATTVNAVGEISYYAPNIVGASAQLYNQTYAKVVDNTSPNDVNPSENYLTPTHAANTTYSDLQIVCTLDQSEPSGQAAFDDASVTGLNAVDQYGNPVQSSDPSATYIFNEIGLKTYDTTGNGDGALLSHLIFHPVQKSLNRAYVVKYTIRFVMA